MSTRKPNWEHLGTTGLYHGKPGDPNRVPHEGAVIQHYRDPEANIEYLRVHIPWNPSDDSQWYKIGDGIERLKEPPAAWSGH